MLISENLFVANGDCATSHSATNGRSGVARSWPVSNGHATRNAKHLAAEYLTLERNATLSAAPAATQRVLGDQNRADPI
jgi:hypothetical protein